MLHIATVGKECAAEYAESCARYGEQPLRELIDTIGDCSADFFDALGTIYEYIVITKGKSSMLGQFFTPQIIAHLMASLLHLSPEDGKQQTVCDPCCGSGRTLLAAGIMYGSERWRQMFFGKDIDIVSVKMTTLNMWLNIMPSIIEHGDTMAVTTWRAYEVIVNWEPDPQAEQGGRWFAFVERLSDKACEALQAIAQQPDDEQKEVTKAINAERVKNVQAHKERRSAKPKTESPPPTPSAPQPPQQQLF